MLGGPYAPHPCEAVTSGHLQKGARTHTHSDCPIGDQRGVHTGRGWVTRGTEEKGWRQWGPSLNAMGPLECVSGGYRV